MESCAISVAQRMSPAADVWVRGRKARAPATGVDGTGAAWPRSLTLSDPLENIPPPAASAPSR